MTITVKKTQDGKTIFYIDGKSLEIFCRKKFFNLRE